MRHSEELVIALLLERQQHEFDKEWIRGVKKAWKQIYMARKKYPGRVVKSKHTSISPKRDHKALQAAAKASRLYLLRAKGFIENLQQDLLINKGFWHVPSRGVGHGSFSREKSTIVKALHNAIRAFDMGIGIPRPEDYGYDGFVKGMTSTHPAYVFGDNTSVERLNSIFFALHDDPVEMVEKVNGYLSRGVWKTLDTFINKYGDGKGTDADNPFSLGQATHSKFTGFEPSELNIGRVRVIFLDSPADPSGLKRQKQKTKSGRDRWVDPRNRKQVIDVLKKAQAALKKRGLADAVWYGNIGVMSPGATYQFKDAKGGTGTAAADYSSDTDSVRVYGMPFYGYVIHELGHRYYRKIMSQKDRDAFDKWFGQVKATSEYGSTQTSEDFAEVFAEYVMGKMKLDQDQVQRFVAVLKHKTQVDEPATFDDPALSYERVFTWAGTKVAIVDLDLKKVQGPNGMVRDTKWGESLKAIQFINKGGAFDKVKRMWAHGVVVRPSRPGYPPIDYDAKAGVLTLGMDTPLPTRKVVQGIGMAYYHSDFVTPKMRAAWEDLWSKRLRVSKQEAAERFGVAFRKEVMGQSNPDSDFKEFHYLYWMLGLQSEPESAEKVQEPHAIPTPRQMHQRSRMRLPGMEWRQGRRLSAALMEAL